MNRNRIAFAGLLVAVAFVSDLHGRVQQHKKQAKIMSHMADEILVAFRAYARTQKKISDGEYVDPKTIKENLEFEFIRAHYE